MKKYLLIIILALFSFSATNAEIRWKLSDDGTLTISGTDMPDYRIFYDTNTGQTIAPWYSEREKIKKIVIENGVTSIGQEAFTYCVSLTSITIPNSVTSIGGSAFTYCESLTSITIPNSVTSIGDWAFGGCLSLTSVTIPNSVTSIGESAFDGCKSLTSITIPNSVTRIEDTVFSGCSGLTSITIPNSVTSIGSIAFYDCSVLESITIPNSVTSIERYAFSDCSGLTSIIVEEGNAKYDSRDNCNAIIETKSNTLIAGCKNAVIPNTVTSIGEGVFFNCYALTSITFEGSTPPRFEEDVFKDVNKSIPVYVPANSIEAYKKALGDYFPETSIRALQH